MISFFKRNNFLFKPNKVEVAIKGFLHIPQGQMVGLYKNEEGVLATGDWGEASVSILDWKSGSYVELIGEMTIDGEVIITDRGVMIDNDFLYCSHCSEKMPLGKCSSCNEEKK